MALCFVKEQSKKNSFYGHEEPIYDFPTRTTSQDKAENLWVVSHHR